MESYLTERQMREVIMNRASSWRTITGRVQESLVLANYVSDVGQRLNKWVNKLYKSVCR